MLVAYDLPALPVIDSVGRPVGAVTETASVPNPPDVAMAPGNHPLRAGSNMPP